jgi:hypothetical protein
MTDNWYYVHNGNRQGPVAFEVLETMISKVELKNEDYVWKKGFENWKKIKDVPELQVCSEPEASSIPEMPETPAHEISLSELGEDDRSIFIRIGSDRGGASSDYGPFSIKQLKKLNKENRINGKTSIFIKGMKDFKILGDFPEFEEIFEEMPPVIQEKDRRNNQRKPFVARLLFENNKNVEEGICRDISIGGMQVLMDEFKGKAGDAITINVHPENTEYHFTASGVVVRVLEGNSGFSFRFDPLSDEARSSVEKYIKQN